MGATREREFEEPELLVGRTQELEQFHNFLHGWHEQAGTALKNVWNLYGTGGGAAAL